MITAEMGSTTYTNATEYPNAAVLCILIARVNFKPKMNRMTSMNIIERLIRIFANFWIPEGKSLKNISRLGCSSYFNPMLAPRRAIQTKAKLELSSDQSRGASKT
jgi:hypothetical protein